MTRRGSGAITISSRNPLVMIVLGAVIASSGIGGGVSWLVRPGPPRSSSALETRIKSLDERLDTLISEIRATRTSIVRHADRESHEGALSRDEARILWQELRLSLQQKTELPPFNEVLPR